MKLTISTILLLPLSALAADCGHKFMNNPDSTTLGRFWTARERMCNCIASQTGYCGIDDAFFVFAAWGQLPSEQVCWDATGDIINQCIANGWNSGLYQLDGSTFQITRKK